MAGSDPYTDDNGALKNRFGLSNPEWLEEAEVHFSKMRNAELEKKPIEGNYDLEHLQKIHHHLFQDMYEWAGQVRTVDISKGNSHFCRTEFIAPAAAKVFKDIAADMDKLKGCNKLEFCERVGHHLGEINALHPFREGNGRAQRAFITQLAQECGREIDWSIVSQKKMIEASIEANIGNSNKMTDLLLDCVGMQKERGKEL